MRRALLGLLALLAPIPAFAQFPLTEVSRPGRPPLLMTDGGATFESLGPGHTYNVYRRKPGEGFRCLTTGLATSTWPGDPQSPAGEVWWYTVNAFDGSYENRHGSSRPIDLPCTPACVPVSGQPTLHLEPVTPVAQSIHLTAAPGDPSRYFVVSRPGSVSIVRGGSVVTPPFLDIQPLVSTGGERGMLSMAFHPQYATNRRFFVFYTAVASTSPPLALGDIVVAEYLTSATDPDRADPASGRIVFTCPHPAGRHNGGQLAFGPDGYLYIALGDGTFPLQAPDLSSYLGKILRIDVDRSSPPLAYAVPPTNPHVGTAGARPEIWASGLRNPWRFSLDRITGALYIGDVGQDSWEEIDVQPGTSAGGEDYGWPTMEANACFDPPIGCNPAGLVPPVVAYPRTDGCTVIGGMVYRGCRLPGYHGAYFYADYCSGRTWSFVWDGVAATDLREWTSELGSVAGMVSFGEDASGNLYIVGPFAINRISD